MRARPGERASLAYHIWPSATYLVLVCGIARQAEMRRKPGEMIIMEAILSASTLLHGRAAQSVGRSVVRTFKRWRAAYMAWHRERRAMAELFSMSDRNLRDIGISRCEILYAVRGHTARSTACTTRIDGGNRSRGSLGAGPPPQH
jgi:uncharacterized protein YjiS (DUF1127 family)